MPPEIEVDGRIYGDDEEIFANKTSRSGRRHRIGGGGMTKRKIEEIPDLRFGVRLGLQEKESEILMATLDFDVPMVPAGEPSSSADPSSKKPKHFKIKK
ncbi:hypothetical protein JHK82_052351 [Glycine max]|nr:hypothetical protein JHK86_052183 [Glycine max]KAG4926553.1 hypothetical protein JHK85_053039 [Glycine max]KAG5082188.1 hypothetical protein JHK84_052226 [Glycine max]KAG5084954.1 hypothetical protein JHK82_052351 [Glycine max]